MKKPAYFSKGFGFFVLSVIFLWGVCAWILLHTPSSTPACHGNYRKDTTIAANGHRLQAQIARTPQEQAKGLGGRACLGQDQAMLFVFDKAGYYAFWMKDMKFNLDIAWVSADKQVIDIQKNLAPASYPNSFLNSEPAKYVIELAGGQADSLGIQTGSHLNF